MDISNVVSLLMALAALVTVLIAWRKFRPEYQTLDGKAALQYADLVDRAAKREREYMDKIEKLEERVEALETCQNELEEKVELAEKRADKFENWAKRLAHQVSSLGAVPVPLETKL